MKKFIVAINDIETNGFDNVFIANSLVEVKRSIISLDNNSPYVKFGNSFKVICVGFVNSVNGTIELHEEIQDLGTIESIRSGNVVKG